MTEMTQDTKAAQITAALEALKKVQTEHSVTRSANGHQTEGWNDAIDACIAALKSPPPVTEQPAPEVVELVWQKVVDQCGEQMSYANHKKKVAEADYHNSEIYHQEGRWHCANDIQEWAEKHLQRQRGGV